MQSGVSAFAVFVLLGGACAAGIGSGLLWRQPVVVVSSLSVWYGRVDPLSAAVASACVALLCVVCALCIALNNNNNNTIFIVLPTAALLCTAAAARLSSLPQRTAAAALLATAALLPLLTAALLTDCANNNTNTVKNSKRSCLRSLLLALLLLSSLLALLAALAVAMHAVRAAVRPRPPQRVHVPARSGTANITLALEAYCLACSNASATSLLVVGDLSGSPDDLVDYLATLVSCVCVVRTAGYGMSDAATFPRNVSIVAQEIAYAADELQNQPYYMVGLGYGGLVLQHLFQTRPDLFAGLVLVDTRSPLDPLFYGKQEIDAAVADLVSTLLVERSTSEIGACIFTFNCHTAASAAASASAASVMYADAPVANATFGALPVLLCVSDGPFSSNSAFRKVQRALSDASSNSLLVQISSQQIGDLPLNHVVPLGSAIVGWIFGS